MTINKFAFMKRPVLFVFSLVLLSACSMSGKQSGSEKESTTGSPQSEKKVSNAPSAAFDMEGAERDEIAALLQGSWYADDYLSVIEETKSVYEGFLHMKEKGPVISCYFPPEQLLSDNPMATGSSSHEGGFMTQLTWNEEANFYTTSPEGGNSLAQEPFSIHLLSDSLMEFRFESDRPSRKFRKIKEKDLAQWLNNHLFTGTYELENGDLVQFHSDGLVEGQSGKLAGEYRVVSDFFEMDMDAIQIYPRTGSGSQFFHFKMLEEGFELYEIVQRGREKNLGDLANTFTPAQNKIGFCPDGKDIQLLTHYEDLPPEEANKMKDILGEDNLNTVGSTALKKMRDYLLENLLSRSKFGPRITSNYFLYVYHALPGFVPEDERHNGYYSHEPSNLTRREKLLAYAIYRLDRSPENIENLFQCVKPVLRELVPPQTYEKMGIKSKVNGLIDSYDQISGIEDYEDKLSKAYAVADTMTGQFIDYGERKVFRKFEDSAYGFSVYDLNKHIMEYLIPGQERFHSMPADPSFWMRRHHEGNMELVYSILLEIQEMYSN